EQLFAGWVGHADEVVRGDRLDPVEVELAVPGEHNRRNAASALAALELVGVSREEAEPVIARYEGAGHRFELHGIAGGVIVVSDYGHHPAEIAVSIATAREQVNGGRVLVVFRPLRYSRTRHLAFDLARALVAADAVAVADVSGASEPRPGCV